MINATKPATEVSPIVAFAGENAIAGGAEPAVFSGLALEPAAAVLVQPHVSPLLSITAAGPC